ncbi:hypothetical protein ACT4R9_03740 [Ornithobacterium rhinotracheale]|uniref:hypothetical protein n=1 Tax=Ornithobacterium rhinotracheale TaxID=28251 RepID=UPI003FD5DED5
MKLSKFTKYIICVFLLLWIGEKSILAKVHTDNLEFSITYKFLVKQLEKEGGLAKLPKDENGNYLLDIEVNGEKVPVLVGENSSLDKIDLQISSLDNLASKPYWNKADITKLADNLDESIDLSQFTNKLNDLGNNHLKQFHYDYFKSKNATDLQSLIKNTDDLERWKLLKENPDEAFEIAKESPEWEKWSKSNFFKYNTKKGKAFEALVNSKIKKIPPFSTLFKDYTHLTQIHLKGVNKSIIADDLFVKQVRDNRGRTYFRAIISDSKLSKTSPWTPNQKSELINVFRDNPNKKFIEFEVRSDKRFLGNLADDIEFNQSRKIRIYREDVYKIISEGEGIKTPPINMSKINFKD